MANNKFVSKYASTEIEGMLDKVHEDMELISYTQSEINTLLAKIENANIATKISDLTNDSGFITNTVNNLTNYYTKTDTYTKQEVNTLISTQTSGGFIFLNELPTTDISTRSIYLIPSSTARTKNIKDEYINTDGTSNGWELIGSTQIDLTNYVTITALNTALADYVSNTVLQTSLSEKEDKFKYSSMPTANEDYLNKIVQYIGTTTQDYTNGYFYKCVSDGESTPTYSWTQTNVQSGGNSDAVTISYQDFKQLSQAEKDNGNTYFIHDANLVSNFTVMGNRFDKANIYDTTERMIGRWIDGKPIWQKTWINVTIGTTLLTDVDTIVSVEGMNLESNNQWYNVNGNSQYTGTYSELISGTLKIKNVGNSYSGVAIEHVTIQYTKTTDASVAIGTENDYSTDEMIIGTWIDGKPIYQKTVTAIDITIPRDSEVNCGTLTSYDTIIRADAFVYDQYNHVCTSLWIGAYVDANGNIMLGQVFSPNGLANCEAYITIQYTKTTD